MKLSKNNGFTIIETVLFLGVTGLLIIGILVGTGTSISAQRYRDSVASLQSMLQQQYSEVLSVNNDRNTDWRCNADGSVVPLVDSGDKRGQSDCVYLGKYITATDVSGSTRKLVIKSVVGHLDPSAPSGIDDLTSLRQYNMTVLSTLKATEYNINWNSTLTRAGGGGALTFSMLILQSPISGVPKTFINPIAVTPDNDIRSLVSLAHLNSSLQICVNHNGLATGNKLGVLINANTSSANGVERIGDDSTCQ